MNCSLNQFLLSLLDFRKSKREYKKIRTCACKFIKIGTGSPRYKTDNYIFKKDYERM